MPEFPIVDSHVHLWNPEHFRISWLDDFEILNRPYQLSDYWEHTRQVGVQAFVFVEVDLAPHYTFLEARTIRTIAALAEQAPRLSGIVPHAPLEYGTRVRGYLDALAALGPKIKGVRRLLQQESDPEYCLRPDFVAGVQMLPEFGFSFDICIKHYQLPGVIELVKRCPQNSFILDHIAKPDIKSGELDPWRAQIAELAALPNVVCKISGLVTEADHQNWTEAELEPYVARVLEVFGEDRVMFGSDWPVVLLASSYQRWFEAIDKFTQDLSAEAKRKFWAGNATRYYRLETV
jgi:L-fuconolactonase